MKGRRGSAHVRMRTLVVAGVFALTGGLAYAQASGSMGASPQHRHQVGTAVDEQQAQAMMAQRRQMMDDMNKIDQKLSALVAKMNAAQGPEKVDAIAAVVNELATQRTALGDRMTGMQGRIMQHMMQHMMSMQGGMMMMNQAGGGAPSSSLASCPLAKGLAPGDASDDTVRHPTQRP